MDEEEQIRAYYYTLFQVWGPQHWWPARTRFEVIVGAYLTQNTSWTNLSGPCDACDLLGCSTFARCARCH